MFNLNYKIKSKITVQAMGSASMFNSIYHLFKTGINCRTELLIEDILKERTNYNVYTENGEIK